MMITRNHGDSSMLGPDGQHVSYAVAHGGATPNSWLAYLHGESSGTQISDSVKFF